MEDLKTRDEQLLEEALKNNVEGFFQELQKAFDYDGEDYDEDYFITDDIYDIKVLSDLNKTFFGACYAIAIGGPNIYINTYDNVVEGYWGGTKIIENLDYYLYSLGLDDKFELLETLDDYIEELFECR